MSADELHPTRPIVNGVSRRGVLRLGGAGLAATALAGATVHRAGADVASVGIPIEPNAGTWKTWLLTAGDQFRPAAPPDEAATADELAVLRAMATERDAAMRDRISYWDAGAPGFRWTEIANQHANQAGMALDAYRMMALLNAAIHDATIATWDAKYAFDRPRPAAADPALAPAIATPASPSYPSVHAATAGAAAAVLGYLFPDAAQALGDLAEEAAQSRAMAGVAYPSDVVAGLELGTKVGALFVAHGKADGSDAVFDPATMPTGPGIWSGEPLAPTLGTWKPWALASGDQFRPAPPPAPDSPERAAELAELKAYPRDAHPLTELFFWPEDPAGRPEPDSVPFSSNQAVFYWAPLVHLLAEPELARKLWEYRLDTNPPRAARAYALVGVALYDATVACWDGKYHYWVARPNQFDPGLTTVLPTYPNPDYPSGHSTGVAAVEAVMAYLFPREKAFFDARAEEDAASRVWAGIHFRSACEAGVKLGRDVAGAVIARARTDGAD